MKGMLIVLLLAFCSTVFAQDLVAVLTANNQAFVTIEVPQGKSLKTIIDDYGMDLRIAKEAKKSGANYLLPFQEVIANEGDNKIWYRTEKIETLASLAEKFHIDVQYLTTANNAKGSQIPAGKYVLLGYVKKSILTTEAAKVESVPQGVIGSISIAKTEAVVRAEPDSIGGLPVPVGAGYYEIEFTEKNKYRKEGRLGLFKTLGGWYDRKYYALSNDLAVGTVVKIVHEGNGRYVYAKVISKMPGLSDDKQLLIRLNDAGRAALDIWGEEDDIRVLVSF